MPKLLGCQITPASSEPNFMLSHSQSTLSSFSLIRCQVSMLWADFNLNRILCRKLLKIIQVSNSGKRTVLCWISSHVNITGNDTLTLQPNRLFACPLQIQNFQPVISYLVFPGFASKNGKTTGINVGEQTSLHPNIGTALHSKTLSRREAVNLSGLWIGHSRLTHSYLLSGDDQPTCRHWNSTHSECPNLRDIRQNILLLLLWKTYLLIFISKCWQSQNNWFY